MLIVAGTITMKKVSDLEQFMTDARSIIPLARSSDGNLFFTCTVDDPAAGTALMYEQWTDEKSLASYLAREEVKSLFAKWSDRMENAVRKYDASKERDPRENS